MFERFTFSSKLAAVDGLILQSPHADTLGERDPELFGLFLGHISGANASKRELTCYAKGSIWSVILAKDSSYE
jgi:hypothetical protein